MSAAEEDSELRDLLVQNLETSGVLNKLKVRTGLNRARTGPDPGQNRSFTRRLAAPG